VAHTVSLQDIKEASGIEDNDLKRHLQSLACAKYKVLKKHPPGRDVSAEDSFSFSTGFSSNLQKIKISTISARVENAEERKETQDRVDEERRHQTEACIVRIMKDRKHLGHNELVNEVTRQLASRFKPDPLNIKKRIEGLIEVWILFRCSTTVTYMASCRGSTWNVVKIGNRTTIWYVVPSRCLLPPSTTVIGLSSLHGLVVSTICTQT
jgi:cullin 3